MFVSCLLPWLPWTKPSALYQSSGNTEVDYITAVALIGLSLLGGSLRLSIGEARGDRHVGLVGSGEA